MALQSLRLRGALTSLSYLSRSFSSPIARLPQPSSSLPHAYISPSQSIQSPGFSLFQTRSFMASRASLFSTKQYKLYKEGDEITEDTILFEGCDFNHWLITVDFPKDPKPSREEMIATYERICAQGLNISIEEAKKRIYACSTTTYEGFQAVMTEEESEKFKDVPGVVFVLPDSYIDPQNKQYGGDKYENGVITPRPPPVQYQRGGRFRDRNRNPDQPRYDRQGGQMQNQQGHPHYDQQGFAQGGGRNYGSSQNYPPEQNYGPPGQGQRMPMNNMDYARGERGYGHQNYPSQQSYGPPGGYQTNQGGPYQSSNYQGQQGNQHYQDQQFFSQGDQGDFRGDNRNYSPTHTGTYGQGPNTGYGQGDQSDFRGDNRNYSPTHTGTYGQGPNTGYGQVDQSDFRGDNRNYSPTHTGTYGQGPNTGYGQGYTGGGQRSSPMDQRNVQGEHGNYPPRDQTGTNQGRY